MSRNLPPDDLLAIVVDVYRQTRVELARADLREHDELLLLDGAEVLETVLRAEGSTQMWWPTRLP
ncbi:MAG: hypothetical protein GEV08_23825 [Acidimicrobiia bacterium]|nr:hypothetical protein [Acidimicrobiia bacterium]